MIAWVKKIFNKVKPHLFIVLIIGAAFLLRLINILKVGDFSWDEMFSFYYSQISWHESLKLWLLETNPPLHMALLKIWFFLFPQNEFFARLPSLIFGTANIFAIYLIGKKFFDKKTGLFAALILTVMPYHIFLSGFARGYSLLLLLSTVSLYYFFQIMRGKNNKRNFIILSATNLLALFTHLTAALLFISQFIILVKQKPILKNWLLSHTPTVLIFSLWFIPSLLGKLSNPEKFGTAWFFNFNGKFWEIFTPLKLLFFGPAYNSVAIIIMCLFAFFLYQTIKKTPVTPLLLPLIIFFFLPIVSALVLHLWNIKFFIISLPAGALLFAFIINQQAKDLFISACVALILATPGLVYYKNLLPLSDWDRLNKTVIENTQKKSVQILISNNFVDQLLLNRYYHASEAIVFYPVGKSFSDREIVTENYLHYLREEKEIADWAKANHLENYEQVFVLQEDVFGVDIVSYLDKTGQYTKHRLPVTLADPRKFYLYEKD